MGERKVLQLLRKLQQCCENGHEGGRHIYEKECVIEDGTFDDLADILGHSGVEVVGGFIYDTPHDEFAISHNRTFPRCLRHRGVSLNIGGKYFLQGEFINLPLSSYAKDINYLKVQAISGAIVAMRREYFLKIGGFNEAYFDGLEDIDICLRANLINSSKTVVCTKFKILEYNSNQHQIKHTSINQNSQRLSIQNKLILSEYFAPILREKLKNKVYRDQLNSTK